MWNLTDMAREGETWRVSEPIVASMNKVIASPRDFFAGVVNIAGEPTVHRGYGLLILGWTIDFECSAASSVTICARTPWITEGNTVDDNIMVYTRSAAAILNSSVPCCIPLTPGGYRFESSPQSTNGASLVLKAGTNVSGMLTIWGLHTQGDWGRYSLTSSPATF
jgi:hypothetical protein